MKTLILIGMLLAPIFARADWTRGWSMTDTALEAGFAAAVVYDGGATMNALRQPFVAEANPLLGEHPSDQRVRIACGLAMLGHAAISYLLPPGKARGIWQTTTLEIEVLNDARTAIMFGAGFRW